MEPARPASVSLLLLCLLHQMHVCCLNVYNNNPPAGCKHTVRVWICVPGRLMRYLALYSCAATVVFALYTAVMFFFFKDDHGCHACVGLLQVSPIGHLEFFWAHLVNGPSYLCLFGARANSSSFHLDDQAAHLCVWADFIHRSTSLLKTIVDPAADDFHQEKVLGCQLILT